MRVGAVADVNFRLRNKICFLQTQSTNRSPCSKQCCYLVITRKLYYFKYRRDFDALRFSYTIQKLHQILTHRRLPQSKTIQFSNEPRKPPPRPRAFRSWRRTAGNFRPRPTVTGHRRRGWPRSTPVETAAAGPYRVRCPAIAAGTSCTPCRRPGSWCRQS